MCLCLWSVGRCLESVLRVVACAGVCVSECLCVCWLRMSEEEGNENRSWDISEEFMEFLFWNSTMFEVVHIEQRLCSLLTKKNGQATGTSLLCWSGERVREL